MTKLQNFLQTLLDKITAYDNSSAVNSFMIGTAELWLDKATRNGLAISLDAEKSAGKTSTILWYGSNPPKSIEIGIDSFRNILSALEVYAKDVFSVTQRHKAAAYALDTIDAIKAYDHTVGYPEKLIFE